MNRIDQIFFDLRARNAKALIPFICAGHPRPDSTRALIPALAAAGASIIEVGIPFSDPIADGPVIAAAMHDAIAQGVTPPRVFEDVAGVRGQVNVGLVAMCSVSIVRRAGGAKGFSAAAARAGFDGLIIPDAPLEESEAIVGAARDHGLTATMMIAPTTPLRRAEAIVKASTGFVYLLARTGITGEQADAPDIASRVQRLRQMTPLPIAVGFGISTAEHVRAVTAHADAAIVGSALVRRLSACAASGADPSAEASAFIGALAAGLDSPG